MTTLTFALDPVDQAVKALLDSVDNLNVHYGTVTDTDNNAKTIGAPLPYVKRTLGNDFAPNQRVGGHGTLVTRFFMEYVGASDSSCKSVRTTVRGLLDGAPVTIAGRERRIRLYDLGNPGGGLNADQTWTRPDGGPLFSITDAYDVL